jgi:hypothetical protein
MKKFFLLVLLITRTLFTFSQQNKVDFAIIEDSLKKLGKIILNGETEFIKYNANEKFLTLLEGALISDKSFDYPFDSLITIARLMPDDKRFRIFNWNLKKDDGTYEYFGIIQAWSKKEKKYILYPLKDNSDKITNPEMQLLEPLNWYGAHYYKIIYNKYGGKKYYTLLGWDGNNTLSQKKIIDVITFNSNDKPVFGASVFKYNKKIQKRIIFEYNASVSMSLKYDKQFLIKGKKKRAMIIYDRLSPQDANLVGMYEYYYPETNIYDGLIFKNGRWLQLKDIDARNTKETREEKNHRQKVIKDQNKHKRDK